MTGPAADRGGEAGLAALDTGWHVREARPGELGTLLALGRHGLDAFARAALDPGSPASDDGDDGLALVLLRHERVVAHLRVRRGIGLGFGTRRCWYHVGGIVHASAELRLFQRHVTLLLGQDLCGATELADLVLDESALAAPGAALARRLLVAAALSHLAPRAGTPEATGPDLRVICELPGLRDAAGQSPFWDGLGARFRAGDPWQWRERLGASWLGAVAALMPRHPVYASFLPEAAQHAIGRCAPSAQPWRDALEALGLRDGEHVTLADGGPVLAAPLRLLPAVRALRWLRPAPSTVAATEAGEGDAEAGWWLLSTPDAAGRPAWRPVRGMAARDDVLRVAVPDTFDASAPAPVAALPLSVIGADA